MRILAERSVLLGGFVELSQVKVYKNLVVSMGWTRVARGLRSRGLTTLAVQVTATSYE